MPARNVIQFRRGYSMGYSGAQIGDTLISGNTWTGGVPLAEGEIGYEIDSGRFKIGRRNVGGALITWENLDYAGGGGLDGGVIPGSGIGILVNASGDDTIYSILTNDTNDTNITINSGNITDFIAGASGSYYKLGLANSLTNIEDITISGDLSAYSGNFTGGVNIGGNLTVSGSSISFDAATITLVNLSATSGNFTNDLTVSGVPVSIDGHGHVWNDINIVGSDFCDDVGDCVNTQIIGSSGVQFIYDSNGNILRAALSGEALAQHNISDTGFIVRTATNSYRGGTITGGSNIGVSNGNGGSAANTVVSLSGTLTGLTSVASTTFVGALNGNADTASQVATTLSTSSSEHYLTFVDSNNVSATAETVYTASGIKYIPSTNTLIVGNLSGVTINGTASQADTIKTLTASDNATYYLTFVDGDNGSPGAYESLRTDGGIKYNPASNLATFDGDISASGASITNNLIVGGNLTVNGTTVTANVDNMIVEDPIIVLGKPSGAITAENKDRGIEFVYPSGSSTVASTGFFGFDKSATEFIAARDVTITSEIVTVNNNSYLDARFKDIDGSTITASTQFSGPASGLSGHASNLTVSGADHLNNGSGGSIPYQSSADITTFLDIGTSGQYLRVNNGATAPEWDTLSYTDITGTPTIGDATLTFSVNGSGLSIGSDTTFTANSTAAKTFSVTSNATPSNSGNAIVSRDASGNFSAGTITANLTGTATNATNINISDNNSSDTSTYLVIVGNNSTGNQSPFIDSSLFYSASSNTLTTINYAGEKVSLNTATNQTAIGLSYNADNTFSVISSGTLLLGVHVDSTSAPFRVISNGTITHGTWNGNTIGIGYGGTNITTYTQGDLLYASATNTLSKLTIGSANNVLLTNGTAPNWGKVGLTTHVSGTLPVGNGGTGATTLTGTLIGNGINPVSSIASTTAYALFRVNAAGNGYEFSTVIDGGTP